MGWEGTGAEACPSLFLPAPPSSLCLVLWLPGCGPGGRGSRRRGIRGPGSAGPGHEEGKRDTDRRPLPSPTQPSQKTFKIKRILAKKQKQNRPLPQWIRLKTGNTIKYNAKRRHWRRTKLGL